MGLPAVEAKVIMYRFAEEFRDTPAPYYGVNIIDVNEENWDPFIEQIRITHAGVRDGLGGRSHLWTVRDFGATKRVLWVNYYPENVGELNSHDVWARPELQEYWIHLCSLVERWEWFCTSENPSEAPL